MKRHFLQSLRTFTIAAILSLTLIPAAAFAGTAAGTKVTNTASVTWSGMTGPAPTASAIVTINLLPAPPNVAYVSTAPGTTVGAASAVTMTYTVTSAANGTDTYDLDLSSVDSANLTAPTFAGGNPTTVSLGASMALNAVTTSNTVVIPGLAANHGLAAGETVVIGGTPYTINTAVEAAGNTTLTLYDFGTTTDASVSLSAGDMIYEQRILTFDMTTGTFTGGTLDETHALTLTATSQTVGTATGSVADPTITVARATLGITKTADVPTAQPGGTITYTITVTNGGTSSAANVTITDATPVFTTYVVGSGSYQNDGGPVTAFTEADINAGLNVGSLVAGKSVVITFQVKVD